MQCNNDNDNNNDICIYLDLLFFGFIFYSGEEYQPMHA